MPTAVEIGEEIRRIKGEMREILPVVNQCHDPELLKKYCELGIQASKLRSEIKAS